MRWLICVCTVLGCWSLAWADVYKCPDGQGGFVLRYGGCAVGPHAPGWRAPPSSQAPQTRWELRATRDQRTVGQRCTLFSPPHAVLVTPQDRATIRLAIAFTRSQAPLVTMLSAGAAWGARAAFHHETHDVGIWVDRHPFMPVDMQGHAAALGFFAERSQDLVRQLQTGTAVQFRVRFWPAAQTFDGAIPLEGFAEGYEALTRCAGEGT